MKNTFKTLTFAFMAILSITASDKPLLPVQITNETGQDILVIRFSDYQARARKGFKVKYQETCNLRPRTPYLIDLNGNPMLLTATPGDYVNAAGEKKDMRLDLVELNESTF